MSDEIVKANDIYIGVSVELRNLIRNKLLRGVEPPVKVEVDGNVISCPFKSISGSVVYEKFCLLTKEVECKLAYHFCSVESVNPFDLYNASAEELKRRGIVKKGAMFLIPLIDFEREVYDLGEIIIGEEFLGFLPSGERESFLSLDVDLDFVWADFIQSFQKGVFKNGVVVDGSFTDIYDEYMIGFINERMYIDYETIRLRKEIESVESENRKMVNMIDLMRIDLGKEVERRKYAEQKAFYTIKVKNGDGVDVSLASFPSWGLCFICFEETSLLALTCMESVRVRNESGCCKRCVKEWVKSNSGDSIKCFFCRGNCFKREINKEIILN